MDLTISEFDVRNLTPKVIDLPTLALTEKIYGGVLYVNNTKYTLIFYDLNALNDTGVLPVMILNPSTGLDRIDAANYPGQVVIVVHPWERDFNKKNQITWGSQALQGESDFSEILAI